MIGEWNNGTGRRKSSVARVFMKKGTGKITVNDKDIQEFFGRQTSIMIVKQPLFLTNHVETFDIKINVHGGGESGQAGAVRVKSNARMSACTPHAASSISASANFCYRRNKAAQDSCCGFFSGCIVE